MAKGGLSRERQDVPDPQPLLQVPHVVREAHQVVPSVRHKAQDRARPQGTSILADERRKVIRRMKRAQKVNLTRKNVASHTLGIPNSAQQFKMIKVRASTYFRLQELRESRRGRCTFNRLISDLLDFYEKGRGDGQ